ncbi:MAG: sodium:solute symporter [Candidatus Marinimicrobia bacterium]|nr:sodium:solute symporter [Candidatus Neomarinimicrobiota bacterium]
MTPTLDALDIGVLVIFLGGTVAYGLWSGRHSTTTEAYFLAGRTLPWWAVMLSVVATETSVLTFISVPGIAYRGNWFFLQLALGYILGRIAVSILLLPLYYAKGITSIYQYIGQRFGRQVQRISSAIFMVTRILADGVRFFATALLMVTLLPLTIPQAVLLIGGVTLIYTLAGGIRAVVWMDALQFGLYVGCGLISLYIIHDLIEGGLAAGLAQLGAAGKLAMINLRPGELFSPMAAYAFPAAVLGGGFLSFASHGTDHMMVQRLLSTRSLTAARMALVGSGLFVFAQFALFMLVGGLLWVVFQGEAIGVDQEYPRFIVTYLPPGLRGVLLAGVLAAAMSTLSSSINSLASSTVNDWLKSTSDLRLSRFVSLGWGLVLMVVAVMFQSRENPVVELGLQIASYTYGGLLGLFLLGRTTIKFHTAALVTGLLGAAGAVLVLKGLGVAWTWYILVATAVNMGLAIGVNWGLTRLRR